MSQFDLPTKPTAPEKPLPGDCCDSGCTVCVFDAYADAQAAYQEQLRNWQQSQHTPRQAISEAEGKV